MAISTIISTATETHPEARRDGSGVAFWALLFPFLYRRGTRTRNPGPPRSAARRNGEPVVLVGVPSDENSIPEDDGALFDSTDP